MKQKNLERAWQAMGQRRVMGMRALDKGVLIVMDNGARITIEYFIEWQQGEYVSDGMEVEVELPEGGFGILSERGD